MLKDLLHVLQPKYLGAVNSILRPYFNHTVVVKTREDAKRLVAYFLQHKLGYCVTALLIKIFV
jgi:chromosome segregation ATPase